MKIPTRTITNWWQKWVYFLHAVDSLVKHAPGNS